MTDDIVVLSRECQECGFPVSTSQRSSIDVAFGSFPCPYCGQCPDGSGTSDADGDTRALHDALYGVPLVSLQQLKLALRAVGDATPMHDLAAAVAPAAQPLAEWIARQDDADVASVHARVSTIVDVLLTLYVISEEVAPPNQVDDVVVNVLRGQLHRLPLPPRGPCFCSETKRYKKCHGRLAA